MKSTCIGWGLLLTASALWLLKNGFFTVGGLVLCLGLGALLVSPFAA